MPMRLLSWGSSQQLSGCLKPPQVFFPGGPLASKFPTLKSHSFPIPQPLGPALPISPPRPEVYLALSLREQSSWMTSWRRQPCQTGFPSRSPAPLLGLLAMTLGASNSACDEKGHSPWIQPTPTRNHSPLETPWSSLTNLTFPPESPHTPTSFPLLVLFLSPFCLFPFL